MKLLRISTALLAMTALGACDFAINRDTGSDAGDLSGMTAGIWVDRNGCDHWILDDGFEGYMSPRLDHDGKPICREGAVPWSTVFFEDHVFGNPGKRDNN
jgi:hypothetical protein